MPEDVNVADRPSPLIPPRITPPREPLSLLRLIPNLLRNPLRTIPQAVYEEPSFAPPKLEGRAVWITDPTLVERVLLKEHDKFRKTDVEHRVFDPIIGGGILTADGQDWRWQRRVLAPLFRPSELLSFVPAISAAAARRLAVWRRAPDLTRRRIDHDMTDVTFDVLTATIFAGSNAAEDAILKHEIGRYLDRARWEIAWALLELPASAWHPYKRSMRRSAEAVRAVIQGLITRERASGWRSGGLGARLGSATDPETGQGMSDDLIASNLATFAAAGHETTAKALTWTLYLLARSPEWQARVREEVAAVAGHEPIRAEHVERLVLTRQVLNESMRLYPPVPVMTRATREPMQLGSHALGAPALVVMPIYVIHRHRTLWEHPDAFDPDRFTSEREKSYLRMQFMPFGFGPRVCIGMSFAMIEAMALLATLVRGARFACDETYAPEPVSRVTLIPKGGMTLNVAINA